MKPYMQNASDVIADFKSDVSVGLNHEQVTKNRETYGANSFTKEKSPSLFKRFIAACSEPMTIILVVAAAITLGVNLVRMFTGGETDFLECIGIFVAIFLSSTITVVMEGRSDKAFEELNKLNENTLVKVIRNGESLMLPQGELVAGDIICVATGDKITADCRIIECTELKSDESALTGESNPVTKCADFICDNEKTPVAERKNMLYSGCFITGGNGKAVVVAVGDSTEFGKIAGELNNEDNKTKTPLQQKMAQLGKYITIVGVCAALVVFGVQLFQAFSTNNINFDSIADIFISSIVLIVAAVPEGLPTIVAMSLALNVIKMSKQNALVRKMVACETVGCINVICSDKTGTLTENKMTVKNLYEKRTVIEPNKITNKFLIDNICINSTADVHFDGKKAEFVGNPTECALIVSAHKSGVNYLDVRQSADVARAFPFSSEIKSMTTVVNSGSGQIVYTKGSPEKVIALCKLNEEEKALAEEMIVKFQSNACRVIGLAHKEVSTPYTDFDAQRKEIESNLVFDGFAAIADPLRQDVYEAVNNCKSSGIDLKILTGDNIVTACAIARELGVLDDNHIAVEAWEIEDLPQDEFDKKIKTIAVIARSTPKIKMRVVNSLKAHGNVVAVTGDGINDAPALNSADVGIAMGITGTDVSKQASDIVLLDDSFSTIVRAIKWGRGIYQNIQRCIRFQLTVNVSSIIVVLASIFAGLPAPFSALEFLWINLIMDGPPAITLGLEPISNDLMKNKPTPRNASIVTKPMMFSIGLSGIYIALIIMLQTFTNFLGGTPAQMHTILFTLFVVFQLFNALNSRALTNSSAFKGILKNKPMIVVFFLTFLLQVVITQFAGPVFGTVPLDLIMWGKITLVGFSVVIVSELVKLFQFIFSKKSK